MKRQNEWKHVIDFENKTSEEASGASHSSREGQKLSSSTSTSRGVGSNGTAGDTVEAPGGDKAFKPVPYNIFDRS